MGVRNYGAALALLALATACGGGGGGGTNFGASESNYGIVHLLAHEPAVDAVQVSLDATIELEFDAAMALDSFGDEDTWLRVDGSTTDVPGTWSLGTGGRVRFTPTQRLAPETDYVFQLSALTCDAIGRIVDVTTVVPFRTYDATAPVLASVDVAANATGVDRTRSFTLTFDEGIARASVTEANVFLRDVYGFTWGATRTVNGATVTLDPWSELPGDRAFTLHVTGTITDRAGNQLGNGTTIPFRTAVDAVEPTVTTAWPAMNQTAVSPRVQPTFTFDESMDAATVEASSLLFQDEFGSIVAFAVDSSLDQKTLRLRPLSPLVANRRYTMAFLLGGAAATDVSGNPLAATQARTFTTGSDGTPPAITASQPAAGESRVPGSVIATVTFAEDLDPAWVDTDTVSLAAGGEAWTVVVERASPNVVRVTPVLELPTGTECVLTLRGGQEGLHDLAGNVLAADTTIAFTTSSDADTPAALLLPPDGATGIAPGSHVTVVFDAPMEAATVTSDTVRVTDDLGTALPGTLTLAAQNRVATFVPSTPFTSLTYYRVTVVGGSSGPRRTTGNWFPQDRSARFRTGLQSDTVAPAVSATLNGIHATRASGLVVPPSGFTIDVTVTDNGSQWPDMGSVQVQLAGAGPAPGAATLLAAATIGYGTFRVQMPAAEALPAGAWSLTVRATDLTGNVGTTSVLPFTVAQPSGAMQPFERPQVVWVRTDLDRDGNQRADFDDDMLRLGFATAGDPIGTNAWLRRVVLDGVLAKASLLYGRGPRGEPIDSGSVPLRFTTREPIGIAHMQLALGGLDPEGDRNRDYGDESSGVLGRAYYDYRNGNVSERNTSNSPGLGVFPAEMWLYQTHIHLQVWPSYSTSFAQRFRPLCPDMGGTPAGAHALDAAVLRADFDYAGATTAQRARWQTVMDAADDWASVIGIILAHEVGHSIGLVAPGASPNGLFGDASLHDTYAGATEVMAPSVGYEAMTTLDYAFRDIDLAYLRQRVLLQ
ncbi:MAG: Ig-like domain-containing protein [Planctomycetes bacterium]|nr:Ig-like domain-containing protein [Planctomycetota bacterium]